jgi:hypothetical protein
MPLVGLLAGKAEDRPHQSQGRAHEERQDPQDQQAAVSVFDLVSVLLFRFHGAASSDTALRCHPSMLQSAMVCAVVGKGHVLATVTERRKKR